ncbi:MAG TPA: hypothetical protein PLP19_10860 [bacterium]|nr:hypothetical protein [bacterium]HPN43980.1 hypothetical protein [bacterium]
MQIQGKTAFRDISIVTLNSFTPAEHVQWRRKCGKTIIESHGVYWQEIKRGFYQPSHLLYKCRPEQIALPKLMAWGVRAALTDEYISQANSHFNVHTISDLQNYDLEQWSSNRRNQYRRSMKRCRFVEILDKDILLQEGFAVVRDSFARIGHDRGTPDENNYRNKCCNYLNDGQNRNMILAGLVDGKLGGIFEVYAVDGFAYLETANFADFALSSYVSIGLHYEFIQVCRRSPAIHTLVHGQVAADDEGLRTYKKSLNFNEQSIPSLVKLLPGVSAAMRIIAPGKYAKLFT